MIAMPEKERIYIAIDLKSFYASVECRERNLDPLDTNLVVADESRTDKTICLAISPSLKSFGLPGRARLFEVREKVREINRKRIAESHKKRLYSKSVFLSELKKNNDLELDFLIAPPRMALYMQYSRKIYSIYLRYIAPEDIHVYSIDEVFIDATDYIGLYKMNAHDFAMRLILDVLNETGITATAGIGTNLYLAKIAMDIMAKHIAADKNGVRIAFLNEMEYRKKLWSHRPLSDFWRIGRGYEKRLNDLRLYTMGDIAKCSLGKERDYYNENLLYKVFGKNAELLIDHAWGYEPCTLKDIKAYKPKDNSIGSGQVLSCPYQFEKAEIVLKEMADSLALDLVAKGLLTNQIVITVGYDAENLKDPKRMEAFSGEIREDHYGRKIPMYAHGTIHTECYTSSSRKITKASVELFNSIVNRKLLIKRLYITACAVIREEEVEKFDNAEQLDLFIDYEEKERKKIEDSKQAVKEKSFQYATLEIKKKFGKNAILKGISLEDGATARERNEQIGGHKA